LSNSPQKQVKLRNTVILVIIGLLLAVWLVSSQWDRWRGSTTQESAGGVTAVETDAAPPATLDPDEAELRWSKLLGRPPVWPDDLTAVASCEEAEADLIRICAVLDSRQTLAAAGIPGGACGLLSEVADALADRPPVLSSELKSYQSIVSNVFHLFRSLGRERLALLRGIVNDEPELAEPAAMAIYRWLVSRESCARSGTSKIRMPVLYDYAGFLFQTMGGQALLRRRTPDTEALVSFYALLILDRADRDGHNPHGVDPRQEIERARALLARGPWVFGERYDSMLGEMAKRWEPRAVD
jgi:hypothetical protein